MLPKVLTGIQGLDEITGGGLPNARPTLVSGGAGSGNQEHLAQVVGTTRSRINQLGFTAVGFRESRENFTRQHDVRDTYLKTKGQ